MHHIATWQADEDEEGSDVTATGCEVTLVGAARERGRAYGESCRGPIAEAIERWCDALADRRRSDHLDDPAATLRAAVETLGAAHHLERWVPGLPEEIAGIAEGAGHDPLLVWALSLMDEVWMLVDRDHPGRMLACSTVGAVPRDAPPLLGQTMDLPPCHAAVPALLHIHPDDGPAQHVLTFAGSVGLCGWNDAGLAVCCNSLSTLPGRADGLPVAGTVRAVLACEDVEAAWAIVRHASHACPQHVAVGGPGGLRGFQVSATGVAEHTVAPGDAYAHTNHPVLDPDAEPVDVPAPEGRADSIARLAHLTASAPRELVATAATLDDRTVPISCGDDTPSDGSVSAVTYAAQLTAPPTVRYRLGPPGTPWTSSSTSRPGITRGRGGSP